MKIYCKYYEFDSIHIQKCFVPLGDLVCVHPLNSRKILIFRCCFKRNEHKMRTQLLSLVHLSLAYILHATIWSSDKIPNPLLNPERCGFTAKNTTTAQHCLCDPEMLIDSPKDRSKLNNYCFMSGQIYIAVISDVLDVNHDMQAFTQSVFDNWGLGTNLSSYNVLILATGVQSPDYKDSKFYIATSQLPQVGLITKHGLTKENLKEILCDLRENDFKIVHNPHLVPYGNEDEEYTVNVEDALTCGIVSTDMYLNGGHSHFPEEDNCIFIFDSREHPHTWDEYMHDYSITPDLLLTFCYCCAIVSICCACLNCTERQDDNRDQYMPIPEHRREGNIQLHNVMWRSEPLDNETIRKFNVVNAIVVQLRENMKNRASKVNTNNKRCTICLKTFNFSDQPITLQCHQDHIYCAGCIHSYLMHGNNLAQRKVCVHKNPECYMPVPNILWEADD